MSGSEEIAGSSGLVEDITEDSLHSDKSKLLLKDAVTYFNALLVENDLITSEGSPSISHEAMLIAQKLYENVIDLMSENEIVIDEELLHENEVCEEVEFEENKKDDSSDEYEPPEKKSKELDYIPLEYKIKCINIAKAHPQWSLKALQSKGCHRLKKKEYLSRWEEEIKKGGSVFDKYSAIDSWTYDRFVEARDNFQQVTTRNVQQWALAAAAQYENFDFKASNRWVARFKQQHGIRQRKVTKFVSRKETVTLEETLAAAETFRLQTRDLIPDFDKEYIINTDQTGM